MSINTWFSIITVTISVIVYMHNSYTKGRLKRESNRNASELEEQKSNEIKILYLRDFSNDGLMAHTKNYGRWKIHFEKTNFETILSESLNKIGHFIAIGRLGEDSYIGAQRYFFSDDEWQQQVLQLMERSSMIIFRPNFTQALVWEFNQIIHRDYLFKTIICTKKMENSDYDDFRKMYNDIFDSALPRSNFWSNYLYFNNKKPHFATDLEKIPLVIELKGRSIENGTFIYSKNDRLPDQLETALNEKTAKYLVIFLVIIIVAVVIIVNSL